MSLFNRLFKPKQPHERGFVNLDFENTFPQVFWITGWKRDAEFPDGHRYKIFSLRYEPDGYFEVTLIHEARDGRKTELQRWSVPPDKFDASAEMIQILEQKFFVKFDRVDLSAVRTFEEFEARSRKIGWEVYDVSKNNQ